MRISQSIYQGIAIIDVMKNPLINDSFISIFRSNKKNMPSDPKTINKAKGPFVIIPMPSPTKKSNLSSFEAFFDAPIKHKLKHPIKHPSVINAQIVTKNAGVERSMDLVFSLKMQQIENKNPKILAPNSFIPNIFIPMELSHITNGGFAQNGL